MPKVRLSVAVPTRNPMAVALVRRVTGLAVSSAAERLAKGKDGWLLVADLYKGDHKDRAQECQRLIVGLRALGIEPYVLYAPSATSWDSVLASMGNYEVSPESMLQVLDEPDQEFD